MREITSSVLQIMRLVRGQNFTLSLLFQRDTAVKKMPSGRLRRFKITTETCSLAYYISYYTR